MVITALQFSGNVMYIRVELNVSFDIFRLDSAKWMSKLILVAYFEVLNGSGQWLLSHDGQHT